jgi:hypothetical protein
MSEFSSFEIFQVENIFTNDYEFSKAVAEKTCRVLAEKEKRDSEKRRAISRSINVDICLQFLLVTFLFYITNILVNMNECKVKQNCSTLRREYLHNWSGSKMLLSVH